ncbi:alkaline phosphatase family protein [Robertmurraya sp. DFI.2.37]|uniref:alkaline phosphatase family protein n=2 Tax=Bacillati TaxID=1783272 RepID=UPI0023DBAD13|nr:alkaline phosphatase family protein [Robertmurraya sp. DFI.2.37]MDF1510269.1 alkaline phosphatase family protein [Robertmurraya sp. DFI.2.37]
MSNKLVVVVVDGMRYDQAIENLGFLEHLVSEGKALRSAVLSELPSISRPLYEVLLTGTKSSVNGIVSNASVKLSNYESIFHLTKKAGLRNATASYYWVSELYNRAPFNYLEDRMQENTDNPIQNGIFYWEDDYPDTHLFLDGESLRRKWNPDFLYIHSMNVDDQGHKHGANSQAYRAAILKTDNILSELIPLWMEEGYQIVITADHGMTDWGLHGGTSEAERKVPLYVISEKTKKGIVAADLPQLGFAPLMCHLMEIEKSKDMISLPTSIESILMKGEH